MLLWKWVGLTGVYRESKNAGGHGEDDYGGLDMGRHQRYNAPRRNPLGPSSQIVSPERSHPQTTRPRPRRPRRLDQAPLHLAVLGPLFR